VCSLNVWRFDLGDTSNHPTGRYFLDLSQFAIIFECQKLGKKLDGGCGVRVLSKPALIKFYESRKGDSQQAEQALTGWYKTAKNSDSQIFADLKQTFGTADLVGNCVVFDVGGNHYRLIGRINYRMGMLFILKVMDHEEYDKKLWVKQCGCKSPPPKSKPKSKMTPKGRDKHR
jgi:mRNA interferase HigB